MDKIIIAYKNLKKVNGSKAQLKKLITSKIHKHFVYVSYIVNYCEIN